MSERAGRLYKHEGYCSLRIFLFQDVYRVGYRSRKTGLVDIYIYLMKGIAHEGYLSRRIFLGEDTAREGVSLGQDIASKG